ncbi:hypothetical protein PSACC_01184 [Paramicrosporidium saccamoebae]|uniref:Uncharacterized protein n=1 Tax=Paramicrosporidium saccamoebae TaxID=1246581 RepID=A0A2H9TMJ9_9FUNG|nr:hypothetical protein PSACC_01184 [Paramicrosporidium saccamoebae]
MQLVGWSLNTNNLWTLRTNRHLTMLTTHTSLRFKMKLLLLIVGTILGSVLSALPDMTPLESTFVRESWGELRKSGEIPENPMHPKFVILLQNRRYLAFIQAVDAERYLTSAIMEPKLVATFLDLNEQKMPLPVSYPPSAQQLIAEIKDIPEESDTERILKRQVIRAFVQFHNKVHKNLNQLALHLLHPGSTDDSSSPKMQMWVEEMIRVTDTSRIPDWIKWLSIHPIPSAAIKYTEFLVRSKSSRTMRHRTGRLESSIVVRYTTDFKNEVIRRLLHEHSYLALLEYVTSPFTRDRNSRKKYDPSGFDISQPDKEQTYFLMSDERPPLLLEAIMTLLGDPRLPVVNKIEMITMYSQLFCDSLDASHADNLVDFVLALSLMPNQQDAWKIRNAFITTCKSSDWSSVVKENFAFSPFNRPIDIRDHWRQPPLEQLADVFVTSEHNQHSRQTLQSRHALHVPFTKPKLEIAWLSGPKVPQVTFGGFEHLISHGPVPRNREPFDIQLTRSSTDSRHETKRALDETISITKPDLSWLSRVAGRTLVKEDHHVPFLEFLDNRTHFNFEDVQLAKNMPLIEKKILEARTEPYANIFEEIGELFSRPRPEINRLLMAVFPKMQKKHATINTSSMTSEEKDNGKRATVNDLVELVLFFEERGYTKTPAFLDLLAYILKEDKEDTSSFRNTVFTELCIGNVPANVTDPMTTRCRELPQFIVDRYREQMLIAMENLRQKPRDPALETKITGLNNVYSNIWARAGDLFKPKYRLTYGANAFDETKQITAYGDSTMLQQAFSLDYVRAVEALNLDSMAPFRRSLIPWISHTAMKQHNRLMVESEILYGLTAREAILDMKYFFGKKPYQALHYTDGFKYFLARAVHTLAAANKWELHTNIVLKRWHPTTIEAFSDCDPRDSLVNSRPIVSVLNPPPPVRQVTAAQILAENERRDQFTMTDPRDPTTNAPLSCTVSLLTLYFDQTQFPFYHTTIDPEFEWPEVVEPAVRPELKGHLSGILHEWLLEVHDNILAIYDKKNKKMLNPAAAILVLKVYIRVLIKYMDFSPSEAKPLLQYIVSSLTIAYKAAGLTPVTSFSTATVEAEEEDADAGDMAAIMKAHFTKMNAKNGSA